MINKSKIAILMLACRDYEAMEVSLACHMEFGDPDVNLYILQNCYGDYDAERTLQVAKRYEKLYPNRIIVLDKMGEASPYKNIQKVLRSEDFLAYDHIIKVDDDAFPIRKGWVDDLISCWNKGEADHGDNLGYVTPLINNNCWGFKQVIETLGLADEYYSKVARDHIVGSGDSMNPFRLMRADEIYTGANGTIWTSPHIARWVHEKTTLQPQFFAESTKDLGSVYVDSSERYSIGAILFRRTFWDDIEDASIQSNDDEHLTHMYCKKFNKIIICQLSIPFVHIAYFSQRSENRDIVPRARQIYQDFTGVNYPIGLIEDRLLEIEARLRWIEKKGYQNPLGNLGSTHIPEENKPNSKKKSLGRRVEREVKLALFKVGLRKKPVR